MPEDEHDTDNDLQATTAANSASGHGQPLPISKSQRKRDAQELHALGVRLVELPAPALAKIPLPADISDSVNDARAMPSKAARRRQLLFIAKQLRQIDVHPILEVLAAFASGHTEGVREHRELEALRDRLLAQDKDALTEYIDLHPQADGQHIRQLVKAANREAARSMPPKSSRLLFRYLRDTPVRDVQPAPLPVPAAHDDDFARAAVPAAHDNDSARAAVPAAHDDDAANAAASRHETEREE